MKSSNPDPVRAGATISRLFDRDQAAVSVYWLAVTGDRNEYARALSAELRDQSVVVVVVRNERFDNPNSVMADLVHVLEANKDRCLPVLRANGREGFRFGVVLLARTELGMSQSSSPVSLPEWVPGIGGQEVFCYIHDLSWRIEVPLHAKELDVAELHRRIYAVESALQRRLVVVDSYSPESQREFFDAIARPNDAGWTGFLGQARIRLQTVLNPDAYRPSVRSGFSVVSRLWGITAHGPSGRIASTGLALVKALDFGEETVRQGWKEGLLGVLNPGGKAYASPSERFAANIMITIASGCRYITCAAHSEAYQYYPVQLLSLVVDDIRRSLADIEEAVIHLDAGEPG